VTLFTIGDTDLSHRGIKEFLDSPDVSQKDRDWVLGAILRFGGRVDLQRMWLMMDETWDELSCDQDLVDHRVEAFYAHPVWLLNGLFAEHDDQSLENRREFADWVASQVPFRIADIGGGYGTLARMIGARCPDATIDIVEPHPHPSAVKRTESCANVRFSPELVGEYDILVATDVFEHVPDPLALVERTASHLRPGGKYLIASCFWPVIKCHLPQTFHFRHSWGEALNYMGLEPGAIVRYGREFTRCGELSLDRARFVEFRSKRVFPWLERLPGPVRRRLSKLIFPERPIRRCASSTLTAQT
jgi:SAM-dependent methyltransferase